jgi:hypothetical protein
LTFSIRKSSGFALPNPQKTGAMMGWGGADWPVGSNQFLFLIKNLGSLYTNLLFMAHLENKTHDPWI